MKKNNKSTNGNLRQQAETKLGKRIKQKPNQPLKEVDALRLLHELQVHQIELEMQNEQLTQSQAEVKAGLEQYTNLYNKMYDLTPVGYFTLSRDGTIQQANQSGAHLLGLEREELIKRRLGVFVSTEFRIKFKDFLGKVFANRKKETCETAFLNGGRGLFWAHLEAIVKNEQGEECLIVMLDITERKHAEEVLRESEERWRSLMNATPDYIALHDEEGRFLFLNHYAEGFAEEEVIGTSLYQYLSPETQEIFRSNIKKALNTWTTQFFEYKSQMGDDPKTYEEYIVPLRGKNQEINIMVVSRDITKRKQAEEALRSSTEFLNSLIASMQDGISVLDKNGVQLDVNSALCKMTGFSREELVGHEMPHPYWLPEEYEDMKASFSKLLEGNFELTFMRKNGERFPVIVSPFVIKDSQGNILSYSATIKDITERKKMEIALQQRKKELELNNILQAERLSKLYEGDVGRAEKLRLQLALDLHDIVLNQLAILRLNVDDRYVTQNFQDAYDEVTRRLREIVTDLRPPMLSYGLIPAIEGLADNMMDRSKDTVNVVTDLQLEGEARYAENIEQHLFRIVQEACENALHHSQAAQINISAKLTPDNIWLLVEDNGNGFPSGGRIELDNLLVNKHFGLVGMLERAMLIGAKVEITSFSGKGTRIQVTWNNSAIES